MERSTTAEEKGFINTDNLKKKKLSVLRDALNEVVIPPVREIMSKEMPKHYKQMADRYKLHRQTFAKHVKELGGVKLNYKSINNNQYIKNPDRYDYNVKDAISLAKIFLEPHMAKFTKFDIRFEPAAVLWVLQCVEEFGKNVNGAAKDVRITVRKPCAHYKIYEMTDENYKKGFRAMESLVESFLQSEDQKEILDKLKERKTQELDDFQYNNLHKEVDTLQDMVKNIEEKISVNIKRERQFKREVHKAILKLRDDRSDFQNSWLEKLEGLEKYFSSEMQKLRQQILGESVDECIDKLSGMAENVMETGGAFSNEQFAKDSRLELSKMRQFTEREKQSQPAQPELDHVRCLVSFRENVDALRDMVKTIEERWSIKIERERQFELRFHEALIKLGDALAHFQNSSLEKEERLRKSVSSEMQESKQRFFEKSLYERIDKLSGMVAKLLDSEVTFSNEQLVKEMWSQLSIIRRYTEET